jgi:hypothetical protein
LLSLDRRLLVRHCLSFLKVDVAKKMLDERNEEDAAAAAAVAVAAAAAAALAASAKDERARLKASLLSQYDIASGEEEE